MCLVVLYMTVTVFDPDRQPECPVEIVCSVTLTGLLLLVMAMWHHAASMLLVVAAARKLLLVLAA
jgi:hypothetical protein